MGLFTHKKSAFLSAMMAVALCLVGTTLAQTGEFADSRDGRAYKTVKMPDGKTWMAENLNYQPKDGKSWCYKNDNSNCDKYGRLYDWNTAMKACPAGWHLPSREEWGGMGKSVGGTGEYGDRGDVSPGLKSTTGWSSGIKGNDKYGFSALPAGRRLGDDKDYFDSDGSYGNWWASTDGEPDYNDMGDDPVGYAYFRFVCSSHKFLSEDTSGKTLSYSVRCVQNGIDDKNKK